MKYNLKYPEAKYLDELEEGVIFYGKGYCGVCGEETNWMSITFSCHICSDECNKTQWSNYANSFHREGVDEDDV